MPVRLRWGVYAGISTTLAFVVLVRALVERPNFYSAAVYLSQSSAHLMIITNLLFVAACSVGIVLQQVLYGPLRPIEIEQLYEKSWFAVTETLLAMTIFRGEIGAWFLIMFFSLLAGKVWGWIGEGRVEILEQQPPRNPRLFHTRLALSLGLSVAFDMSMLEYVVKQVMRMARPDMMVMFGFEFAVLSLMSISTAARYAINLVEIGIVRDQKRRRIVQIQQERVMAAITTFNQSNSNDQGTDRNSEPNNDRPANVQEVARRVMAEPVDDNEIEVEGWEGKGRWIFYLDLATDFVKLVVYVSFFIILLIFYGLPIHIMRDVFLTFRSFLKRISDFMKYRTATRDMNARYPDATPEEISREDVCIICREEMRPYQPPTAQNGQQPQQNPVAERMRPKKLPCGHILHFSCLRSWLERQQICPTCRTPVLSSQQTTTGAAGQAGGQGGAGNGEHQQGNRPGPRVFQFGPLRIGVGAARGNNMFEELQQQLADGRAGAAPPANPNGPQQYGFGIRWDGGRRRSSRRAQNLTLSEQLDAAERQIQQEITSLDQATRELSVIRTLQAELQRLRTERNNVVGTQGVGPEPTTLPNNNVQPNNLSSNGVAPGPTTIHGFGQNQQHNLIEAGSDRLPEGLTLPPGWTLMPLQSAQLPPPPVIPTMHAFNNQFNLHRNVPTPQGPILQAGDNRFHQNPATARTQNNDANATQQSAGSNASTNPQNQSFTPVPNTNDNHSTGAQVHNVADLHERLHNQLHRQALNGSYGSLHGQVNNQTQARPLEQMHEQYLASLRNPDPNHSRTGEDNSVTTNQENATAAPNHVSSNNEIPDLGTINIPSWGFGTLNNDPAATPLSPPNDTTDNNTQVNGAHETDTVETGSSSTVQEPKRRTATVEDLVEDPD